MRLLLTFLLLAAPVAAQSGDLLVVTKQSHALAIIDGDTLTVKARVPIGEDPHEVVVAPDNRTAFISNYGEATLHTIARVDLTYQSALPSIDISPLQGPHGLFIHDQTLWFTVEGSKALGTLDPATGRLLTVLGTGQDKTHLVWVSRDGTLVLASNAASGTLSIFNRVLQTPAMTPGAPPAPASYTGYTWRQTLIPTGSGAEGFAVSPDERQAWVGDAAGHLFLIDLSTRTLTATLTPGTPGANRLHFTPDGGLLLITTHTGPDLVVLDPKTRTILKRISIEQHGASGIAVEPNGRRAFIACPRDHFVAVVDLRTLTRTSTIDAGREPDGLAWWTPTQP